MLAKRVHFWDLPQIIIRPRNHALEPFVMMQRTVAPCCSLQFLLDPKNVNTTYTLSFLIIPPICKNLACLSNFHPHSTCILLYPLVEEWWFFLNHQPFMESNQSVSNLKRIHLETLSSLSSTIWQAKILFLLMHIPKMTPQILFCLLI